MIRGIYAAASAMQVGYEWQDIAAYNISHSMMPGYRERCLLFETLDHTDDHYILQPNILGVQVAGIWNNFQLGPIQYTGHPYDITLHESDHFFELAGPNGPIYTRNGSFFRTPSGTLVNVSGYVLQGQNGAIRFPPEATRLEIASDGTVVADGEEVGRIRTVRFVNPQALRNAGPSLFTAAADAGLQVVQSRIIQGYREGSNVSPSDAMVRLIIGVRYYESSQRALKMISDILQLNTRA